MGACLIKFKMGRSLVAQLRKEILLIEIPVFVWIRILDKLQYVIIAYNYVKVLVEHLLYLCYSHQPLFLSIKESKHIHGFFFSSLAVKPFFVNKIENFGEHKLVFILMGCGDLIFDLLSVHFSEAEVTKNAPQIFSIDVAGFFRIVEVEGIFDFVFLHEGINTIS